MALVGNLKDLKLPSLIQLNCMERNNAKLTIERGGKFGFVYFEDGQVTHAEFDPYIGEEAIFRLLGLFEGKFKVESDVKPPVRTIQTNWSNLLLEGLHRLDHAQDDSDNGYFHLFERLFTLKGVKSASLVNKDGVCIDSTDREGEPGNQPNGAFIMLQAYLLGEKIGFGKPEFLSMLSNQQRYLICNHGENYLVLEIDQKIKSDVILPLIKQALGHK